MLRLDLIRIQPGGVVSGSVAIRSAGLNDFEPLCELYRHSIRCNPYGFIQDLTFRGGLTDQILGWRQAGGDVLVATGDGKVVGLGGLAPQNARTAELCKLHVDPKWQGRGIGRLMAVELVERACRVGFSEVKLHVTATQRVAIALYRSLGFRETDRKPFRTTVFGATVCFDTIYMSLVFEDAPNT